MDIPLLASTFTGRRNKKNRIGVALGVVGAITAIDVLTALQLRRLRAKEKRLSSVTQSDIEGRTKNGAFRVSRSITLVNPPSELYQAWHNFENLPLFMFHLQRVDVFDARRSHWVTQAPLGRTVEWDAVMTEDRPNELIAWQSTGNADVPNSGSVSFEALPENRGTVVRVTIEYRPPAGVVGRTIAMLFGDEPGQQVAGDLRRFKQVMETGEVLHSDGTPRGTGQAAQRPAQPMPASQAEQIAQSTYERPQETEPAMARD